MYNILIILNESWNYENDAWLKKNFFVITKYNENCLNLNSFKKKFWISFIIK